VDFTSEEGRWRVLREGAIPTQEIRDLLGPE